MSLDRVEVDEIFIQSTDSTKSANQNTETSVQNHSRIVDSIPNDSDLIPPPVCSSSLNKKRKNERINSNNDTDPKFTR